MSILTNGETLHNLLDPIKNRFSHYSDIVTLLTSPFVLEDDEGFDDVTAQLNQLITKRENAITILDPDLGKSFTVICELASSTEIQFYECAADLTATVYTPQATNIIGTIKKTVDGIVSEGKWTLHSADGVATKQLDDLAALATDNLTIYSMMESTVMNIITNGKVVASDILNSIKAKVSGVRGLSKTFLDDLTDACTSSNVLSVIKTIKDYLYNSFTGISVNGSWTFSETYVTKDWDASMILSGLFNVVETIGMVVTAANAAVGLALSGIGLLMNTVTSAISDKFNSATTPKIEASEGRELASHILKATLHSGTVSYNTLGEYINGRGPIHFEFLNLDGHAWSSNPDDPDVLDTGDDILLELFPSTKGYVDSSDLFTFINDHFLKADVIHGSGYPIVPDYYDLTVTVQVPYTTKDLLEWYIDHFNPVDWDAIESDDSRVNDAAARCWETARYMLALLFCADMAVNDVVCSYSTSGITPTSIAAGLNFLFGSVFYNSGLPASSNADITKGEDMYHPEGSPWNWSDMTEDGESLAIAIPVLQVVTGLRKIRIEWYGGDPAARDDFFLAPFEYPVVVRYAFHILPPQYDRASLLAGIILTTFITVVAVTAIAVAAIKINRWRTKQQALMQAKTESAWNAMVENPSAVNVDAYRKACLKQNTLGKIFGCSSVSNRNYWGGGSDSSSSDSSIQTIIRLIGG